MDIIKTVKELIDLAEKSNQKVSIAINFYSENPTITFNHHDERYEEGIENAFIWNITGTEEEDKTTLENIKSVLKQGGI